MKIIKKTFSTVAIGIFCMTLVLFAAVLFAAACSDKVTLRFETYGGTPLDAIEGDAGNTIDPPEDPVKEGFAFEGWFLQSDCSGDPEPLPKVLPDRSVTYYAKFVQYPTLKLDTDGGVLTKTEYAVKPGTRLSAFLEGVSPSKWGLSFGTWTVGGVPVGENDVMPESDLTVKAEYLADYRFEVYLERADEPDRFDLSEELSEAGREKDGETVSFELPQIPHFEFAAQLSDLRERTLRAGSNTLAFYYKREAVSLVYDAASPGDAEATGKMSPVESRYGANLTISESAFRADGYVFFGWALSADGAAQDGYAPGKTITMGDSDLTLYAAWAKEYPSARGDAVLTVAEHEENGVRRAILTENGVRTEARFRSSDETFESSSGKGGRLDGKGYFLPDDSGSYIGYSLAEDETDGRFGKMVLDFSQGTAQYTLPDGETAGRYEYVFDETLGYTGKYRFSSEETEFLFLLDEARECFLREGEEKDVYGAYDCRTDVFSDGTLALDGFGGATLVSDGKLSAGAYRGIGGGEWMFLSLGETFRFRLGTREWKVGEETFLQQKGFLRYDGNLAGTYTDGDSSLVLDGYGYLARYTAEDGTVREERYREDGRFVVFLSDGLTFTLDDLGMTFAVAGEEAGVYRGEQWLLLLDGAGVAELYTEDGMFFAQGGYRPEQEGDWLFTPSERSAAEKFRFRTEGGEYLIRDESVCGEYRAFYGLCLRLDGYGGGSYFSPAGEEVAISVVWLQGNMIGVFSPVFGTQSGALYFSLNRTEKTVEPISKIEVGKYALAAEPGGYLFLNGYSSAYLCNADGVRVAEGIYTYFEEENRVHFVAATGENYDFLLEVRDGRAICIECDGFGGTYSSADAALELDGYGGAVLRLADEVICGEYRPVSKDGALEGAEIAEGDELFLVSLSVNGIESVTRYRRLEEAFGTRALYLEQGGNSAFVRGEEDDFGTYRADGETFLFEGGETFAFRPLALESGAFYARGEEESEFGGRYTAGEDSLLIDSFGASCVIGGKTLFFRVREIVGGCLVAVSAETGEEICFLPEGETFRMGVARVEFC